MCGLAGFFQFNRNIDDPGIIKKMTDTMGHRGPDADGFYVNGPVAFGHRRLSIIDLSERSNQPLFDNSGRYSIIFNGEIYNYLEVKAQLKDYSFRTTGDCEVVLAAFIKWGENSIQYLKGMFAFAIWDNQSQKLFIARDRLGIKPLYYYKDEKFFLFASEIRAILASGLVERKINREALVDYLYYQSFQSPQTIVRNVFELPAGCFAWLSRDSFSQKQYWKIDQFEPLREAGDRKAVQKQVYNLLLQSVERRMVSDVPVAAFLSGGIDSSAVVGLMAMISEAPETFNIAFEEKDYDESGYATLVAKKFNTRHHEILVKPELFLQELPNALNAMDTPSGDGVNTYVVSKAVRAQGIKVALSGVGGDELFAGYPIFKQWVSLTRKQWLWKTPGILRKAVAAAYSNNDIKRQRIGGLLKMDHCSISEVYPILRQVNAERTIADLLRKTVPVSQLQATLIDKQPSLEKFPLFSQVSISEYAGYTCQTLVKDTDQMSMANSLEVREPFFDHELIEYVMRVPDTMKNGTMPKSLMIESLGDLIPSDIYQRPKKGFVFPLNHWFRNELRSYCEQKIKLLSQRDFVYEKGIQNYWNGFLNQKNQIRGTNIFLLLALENYIELHNLN